ncbi:MAG: hypothetical protein ACPGTQ_11710 [Colwellia sp.]
MAQRLLLIFFMLACFSKPSFSADGVEPVHYAYANYLGSGIYRASEKDITLINLPIIFDIGEEKDLTYRLRTPVSIGFFGFSYSNIPDFELPDSVGSLTFTPGIQIDYQLADNLVIESYFDLGFARNFTTKNDVLVHSAGISSLYSFTRQKYDTIIATRLYYAAYKSFDHDHRDSYAAFQIGLDTGYNKKFKIFDRVFQPRVFATSYWYFSEVDFLFSNRADSYGSSFNEGTEFYTSDDATVTSGDDVTLSNSFEVGVTMRFDKDIGYSWASIDTIGLSYRFSGDYSAMRLLFTFPI